MYKIIDRKLSEVHSEAHSKGSNVIYILFYIYNESLLRYFHRVENCDKKTKA